MIKKTKKSLYISLALTAVFALEALALESPVRSPIGSPSVPPSAYIRSQPATSANIYGGYGNYNQRRLDRAISTAQTRGFVPYNSSGNANQTRGLNRLRSILRRSDDTYSPLGTSAKFRSIEFEPSQLMPKGGPDIYDFGKLPNEISLLDLAGQRPMSTEIADIEMSLDQDIKLMELREKYGDDLEMGILNRPVRKANPDITDLFGNQKPLEPQTPDLPGKLFEQPKKLDDIKDGDVYDSLFDEMEQDELAKQLEERTAQSKYGIKVREFKPIPEADHKKAAEIRGKYKTFEELAEASFAEYIVIAKKFMSAGKFYKAADAYTLASVWMPENPEAYGKKGLALFATGEYMSASFYIQQAISLSDSFVKENYDIDEFIGDIDLIDNRLVEAKQWQRQTNSPELALLVAYINYQQGNIISAAEMMEKAAGDGNDEKAVNILQQIIDEENRY